MVAACTAPSGGVSQWPYAVSADERIIEMDYDKLVYEKDSPYQNIRIVHSKKNGNTLFLDGDASMYPMRTTLITKM